MYEIHLYLFTHTSAGFQGSSEIMPLTNLYTGLCSLFEVFINTQLSQIPRQFPINLMYSPHRFGIVELVDHLIFSH